MAMLSPRVSASAIRYAEVVKTGDFTIDRSCHGKRVVCGGGSPMTVTVASPATLGPDFDCLLVAGSDRVKLEPASASNWLKSQTVNDYPTTQMLRLRMVAGRLLCEHQDLPELFNFGA